MRIKIIKFDVYGCKYTKNAVKTPQFTKEIAVFLPQNMIFEEKSHSKCKDDDSALLSTTYYLFYIRRSIIKK